MTTRRPHRIYRDSDETRSLRTDADDWRHVLAGTVTTPLQRARVRDLLTRHDADDLAEMLGVTE